MDAKTKPTQPVPERPKGEPRLVDVKIAMRYAHCSEAHLYRLLAAGKIEARKDGRRTYIDLDSVDAYQRSLPRVMPRRVP